MVNVRTTVHALCMALCTYIRTIYLHFTAMHMLKNKYGTLFKFSIEGITKDISMRCKTDYLKSISVFTKSIESGDQI